MKTNFLKYAKGFEGDDVSMLGLMAIAVLPLSFITKLFVRSATMSDVFISALMIGAVITLFRRIYLNYLDELSQSNDNSLWNFSLNNVPVGTISESDYANLRRKVFASKENYMVYIGSLYSHGAKGVFELLSIVPAAAFWLLVVVAYIDPASLVAAIGNLHKVTPEMIPKFLDASIFFVVISCVLMVALKMVGSKKDASDSFSIHLVNELRGYFQQTALGDAVLVRAKNEV